MPIVEASKAALEEARRARLKAVERSERMYANEPVASTNEGKACERSEPDRASLPNGGNGNNSSERSEAPRAYIQGEMAAKASAAELKTPREDVGGPLPALDSFTLEELKEALDPKAGHKYHPLDFLDNPIALLFWLDETFRDGRRELYDWQIETNLLLSGKEYTQQQPLVLNVCAANGSGKDAYVISLFVVWRMLTMVRNRSIITSSSFQQLNTQTESYIRQMCQTANIKLAEMGICEKAILIKKQHIVCLLTKSEIKLFATDDPGKAEGYHPFPDYADAKMAVIINEAKSVPPEIFKALHRCTGYDVWLEVSSAGTREGDFYHNFVRGIQYPQPYIRGKRYSRRVTAFDCKHFSEIELAEKKIDLPEEEFGSIFLAIFSSVGAKVIISRENLDTLFARIKDGKVLWDGDKKRAGGLDLSLGGDETVLITRTGNIMDSKGMITCRIRDAVALAVYLDSELIAAKFVKNIYAKDGTLVLGTPINTDIGGLGAPIAHMLENKMWNIRYCLNNSPSNAKRLYTNRGTEDWFNIRNAINRGTIILCEDILLSTQLTTRKYDYSDGTRIKLESKEDVRGNGDASPDRADALVLCFSDYEPKEVLAERAQRYSLNPQRNHTHITQKDLLQAIEEERFSGYRGANGLGAERSGPPKVTSQRGWAEEYIRAHNLEVERIKNLAKQN